MLVSCSKCGRIHERGFKCNNNIKKVYAKKETIASKFRNTKAWRDKRKDIINRDKALCQIYIRNLHNTLPRQYNNKVQAHHIVPINEDYTRRLNDDNLICLCTYHHSMAEHGQIKRKELIELVRVSEEKLI
ncbi:HNH endonuclease [uncultured Clostridium sp.]|uniref:HNH endonuclease n=1 Tax=uncultured Clostridium sp. TaxID=59620 RepID=UPI002600F477|nr:HNH endonuclease [uncultured Clostridium sp.]